MRLHLHGCFFFNLLPHGMSISSFLFFRVTARRNLQGDSFSFPRTASYQGFKFPPRPEVRPFFPLFSVVPRKFFPLFDFFRPRAPKSVLLP